jgi:twitching motility protein PilI
MDLTMNGSRIILGTNVLGSKAIESNLGDAYLKFQLNQHTSAVLSIKHTQEVIVLPKESVTSIPNMPAAVLGLVNWRSRIIWVVDLAKMLNLDSLNHRGQQYNTIIIRSELGLLSLVVSEIKGTSRFLADAIQSPKSQVPHSLLAYLRGCVYQDNDILLVLDTQAIMESAIIMNKN